MNFLSIILWVVMHAPQILALIKDLINLIRGIKNPALHAEAMSDLSNAFKEAQASGDVKALKDCIDKWCAAGVGNETTLKVN